MKKHMIFSSDVCETYENIMKDTDYLEEVKEFLDSELIDEYIWGVAYEDINIWYEDEQMNLDEILDDDVVVIADIGLWNGRRTGGKILGDNLNCIINYFGCDDIEIYADRYDVKSIGMHHDGRNYHLFRMIKPDLTDTQRENFISKLEYGELTKKDITRYTKSLKQYVSDIYGF